MEPYTPDGATITIPGFQVSPDANKAFTFTGASDSIAETVGITSSVGLIEVHFYPQRLKEEPETRPGKIMDLDPPAAVTVRPSPPDTKTRPAEPEIAGTKPGTQRTFKTRNVVLEWEDKPVEVWYIFYRYGSPGLSPGYQLVPFVPTTN